MSNSLFGLGRHALATKVCSLTADTLKGGALLMNTAGGQIVTISGATNATPIVITTSSQSWSTGDIVVVGGVQGNLAANGTWQLGTVTSTTAQLLTKLDGVNSTGSGAYTSGGWAINLSKAAALADVSANLNGAEVSLSGVTDTLGVVNASNFTFANLSATKTWGVFIRDSTTDTLLAWIDGTTQVYVVTQAAAAATSIAVQRLTAQIANGTTIVFSDGSSATLTAQANVGDTSLTVSSLAAIVHRQATADVPTLGCGLPVTPAAGGSLQFNVDTGANKLFAI